MLLIAVRRPHGGILGLYFKSSTTICLVCQVSCLFLFLFCCVVVVVVVVAVVAAVATLGLRLGRYVSLPLQSLHTGRDP